ncbi:hypothetical protein R1sor_012708 [Riccia sorocarpa]|uniref:Uncharacterized protein n=1 Tax=Riccia sorocarpa TaxID=122646 RepID=A0ABD3I770_9MARC
MTANQYNVGTSPAQSTVAIKSKYSRDYEKEGKLVISTIPTFPRGKDVEERVSDVSVIDVPVGRLPTTRSSSKRGKPSNLKTSENVESHRKHNQMASDYQTSFFGRVKILKCWGPLEGQFTYAACGGSLKDGRPCGLGVAARMARDQMSSSQTSTQTASVSGKPLRGFQRVNSFNCAELGSPVKASACGESQPGASACVGVVTIGNFLDEGALSESSSFSSTRQRDSLAALLRLQSRLNKMEEELAKAIAALKLEQESELVERNCHWVVNDTH